MLSGPVRTKYTSFVHYTTEINAKCLPIMLALCSMLCHPIMLKDMLA